MQTTTPTTFERFVPPLRAVKTEWPTLRASKPTTSVIFARAGKIVMLDLESAERVAALFGLRPTLAERMRANANRFGQWVIAVDDNGHAEAFVIANPREAAPAEILSVRGGHRVL